MFSFKQMQKALVLLWFRSKKVKKTKHWFYCGSAQKSEKSSGFTTFSLETMKKSIGFTSKGPETNWKTIGFTVKPVPGNQPLGNDPRRRGLNYNNSSWFDQGSIKKWKKHWVYCVFVQNNENSMGFTGFSLKQVKKTLVLQAKDPETIEKPLVSL